MAEKRIGLGIGGTGHLLPVATEAPECVITRARFTIKFHPGPEGGRGKSLTLSLVVARFGKDLRVADCTIRPGVEVSGKTTSPQTWSVNGVSRAAAHLVSRDDRTGRSLAARRPTSPWCRRSRR